MAFLVCVVFSNAACDSREKPQGPWHGWSTLQLKVKSVPFMRGQIEIRISNQADGRRLETASEARFFGATIARSSSVTLLDPANGRAKAYRNDSKKKARNYKFTAEGYTVEKLKRAKIRHPWRTTSTQAYDYPLAEDGLTPLPVYDYFGMILRLQVEPLSKLGDETTIHVATSSGPQAFVVSVAELRAGSRQFRRPGERTKIQVATQELRLSVAPADPESESGFLDMKGEIELWVEAETKTLIEIVGDVPGIPGKVHLVLAELG